MKRSRFFRNQYERCSVERPASIQGETAAVIATDIRMLIDPMRSFDNPQEANVRPQQGRFRADVLDRTHAGVSAIQKFDIIRTAAGRAFVIINPLDAVGTDTLQFELEARE